MLQVHELSMEKQRGPAFQNNGLAKHNKLNRLIFSKRRGALGKNIQSHVLTGRRSLDHDGIESRVCTKGIHK